MLRDGVDIDKHRIYMPDTYKSYIVNVDKISQTKTRILFKNVPIDCPDIELENLCNAYGKREGKISHQFVNVPTENSGNIRMRTSNRIAMVVMHPGKIFKNFLLAWRFAKYQQRHKNNCNPSWSDPAMC